jgi:hypothetical protein
MKVKIQACMRSLLVSRSRQTKSIGRLRNPNPGEYLRVGHLRDPHPFSVVPFSRAK